MTKLLIEIPNVQDARLLLDFARRLNAVVVNMDAQPVVQTPIYWLEQLAMAGSIGSIENPVDWQRKIRKDRKLPR